MYSQEYDTQLGTSASASTANISLDVTSEDKTKIDEKVTAKGPYTRAARRMKGSKQNGDIMEEDLVELKETVKPKRATAMSNASDQRGIQIGKMFQASAVQFMDRSCVEQDADRDVPLWIGNRKKLDEQTLDKYIDEAVGVYRLSLDKALLILFDADYDLCKAKDEVISREVIQEKWNEDDKIIFRAILQQHGKNFSKVREIMPYRSIASIIQFYYQVKKRWKSIPNPPKPEALELINGGSDTSSTADEDEDTSKVPFLKMLENLPPVEELVAQSMDGICENCAQISKHIQVMDTKTVKYYTGDAEKELRMCILCRQYLLKHGSLRPTDLITTLRSKLIGNKDIGIDWIKILDNFKENSVIIKKSRELVDGREHNITATEKPTRMLHLTHAKLREEVAMKKASCLRMESILERDYAQFPVCDNIRQRVKDFKIKTKAGRRKDDWTEDEKYFTIYAIWRYNTDWDAIMNVVPTKTRQQLVDFYESHKTTIEKSIPSQDKTEITMPKLDQSEYFK